MPFVLPPLPYDRTALQPQMSAKTLDLHHGKHHKAYFDKVNGWIVEKGLEGLSIVEIIRFAKQRGDRALFNNAAQAWNHSFFWQCLTPGGSHPSEVMAGRINATFGSTERMLVKLEEAAAAHFASGWAWLVLEGGSMRITSYHDADTPIAHDGVKPLLALDLWEHAYYVDYRNEREKFVQAVLSHLIDWNFVERNLDGEGASRADQEQETLVGAG